MVVNMVDTVLYSITAGATVFALIQSLKPRSQRQLKPQWLTTLLVLLLVHTLGQLFIAAGAYQLVPHLAGAELPIRMLLAPTLYLYTRSLITPEKPSLRFILLALLGPLIIILVMLPFASIGAEDKLALAHPATRDPELFRLAKMTCIAATTVFIALTAAYLVMALRLQQRHRLHMMQLYSNLEQRSLDWLKLMLFVWGGSWTLYAIDEALWVFGWHLRGLDTVLAIVEACTLIAFAHLALNQAAVVSETSKSLPLTEKIREASLDAGRMQRIADRLKTRMAEDKLYTECDLSLRRLAEVSGTTENHLSETFSQFLKTNFFNFVNGYRIDEAKRLLSSTDTSIITIAFEVGFNSRSTFNSAFKKATGVTPRTFRSQVFADNSPPNSY